jgi:hypothetical protein
LSNACGSASGAAAGSRVAGTFRNRSRWTLAAASSTPRNSSIDVERRSPCSTAFAKVNVCSAVSQSPNSLLVRKRAILVAAANDTAEASSTSLAPSRRASSSASSEVPLPVLVKRPEGSRVSHELLDLHRLLVDPHATRT